MVRVRSILVSINLILVSVNMVKINLVIIILFNINMLFKLNEKVKHFSFYLLN